MKYEDVIESLSQQVYELGGEEGLLVIPAEASKRQIKRAEITKLLRDAERRTSQEKS